MNTKQELYGDKIEFLELIEKEYPSVKDILSVLFSKCDEFLEAKNHNGFIGLFEYAEKSIIQLTSETRYLDLISQNLSDELLHHSEVFFTDSYKNHALLIEGYRKTTLLLRRLELFDPNEELYVNAISELSSLVLNPYIVKNILVSELFDDPESLSRTVYESVWCSKTTPERLRYALCFLELYDCNYWKLICADILLSVSEYKSALEYLKKLEKPGDEEKELISSLEAMINE